MKKGTILTLVFLVFIGGLSFALITTGSNYECEVCMQYNDREECQKVEGVDQDETVMVGKSTACGGLANGMTQTIECQNTPPVKVVCKKL
ncbi:MAG: hypothetical protein COV67_10850 [Nitrospinae bacterium CG11_big_fil_rev_8_21_14_0_20_56_8]|nr:MAG: hypothetical protein COV67_10850 [Nitrospinae bacterium CG11_big_fil_rev_8_21_14_0_20_56_8]